MKKLISLFLAVAMLLSTAVIAYCEERLMFKTSVGVPNQPQGTPLRDQNISENASDIYLATDENAIIVRFISKEPYKMEYYISLYDVDKEKYITDTSFPGCPKNMVGPISEGEFKFTNLCPGGRYRIRIATAINRFDVEAEIYTSKLSSISQSEYKMAKREALINNEITDHISFGTDKTVERWQIAQMIRGLLPIMTEETQKFSFGQKNPFLDVSAESYAQKEIEALYWLNILNGNGEGMFFPERAVTNAEVIKMIVCSLGYGAYAQSLGAWPQNYIECGKELGIFVDKDFNAKAFSRDISLLISIAYTLPHMCISEFSADGFAKFYQNENITYSNMR